MARPLVATDAPGCRNLVEPGETGFLCEVRSGRSLAEAMSKIAGLSPGQRAEMGKRARQMVEDRYSDERVNEAYLVVLMTGKGSGRLTPYWLLFAYFAVGAIFTSAWSRRAAANPLFFAGGLVTALMIGFRFHVGGDWKNYERIFFFVKNSSSWDVLVLGDPAFMALNWIVQAMGADLWLIDLICGAVFTLGLFRLARMQPNPWLAILVAVPYLIIVVGMGYTRQSHCPRLRHARPGWPDAGLDGIPLRFLTSSSRPSFTRARSS